MVDQEKRDRLISGLRDLADWLEVNPEVKNPNIPEFNTFSYTRKDFAEQMRLMGTGEKEQAYSYLMFKKTFGPLRFTLNVLQSDVCIRTQVGEREVEARPAVPAHTEPIYEWECPESLMKGIGS